MTALVGLSAEEPVDFAPFEEALDAKDLEGFQRLTKAPFSQAARNSQGFTLLQWISGSAPTEFLKHLVRLGADPRAVALEGAQYSSLVGCTPLIIAAWAGNLDNVKYYESLGIDANEEVKVKYNLTTTALHKAILEGQLKVVQYLYPKWKNRTPEKLRLLMVDSVFDAPTKSAPVAQYLIENGALLPDEKGNSLNFGRRAAYNSYPKILKLLIDRKFDFDVEDDWGNTPIYTAIQSDSINAVRALLGLKVRRDLIGTYNPYIPGVPEKHYKYSLLEVAVAEGSAPIVQLLLDAGFDPNAKNPVTGTTAFTVAETWKRPELVPVLKKQTKVALPSWTLNDEAATGIVYLSKNQGPLTLTSPTGQTSKLSDYKGKVVLMNIWTTWCPYCVEEMASLNELSKSLKDKGLVVIGQSLDEKPSDAVQFMKDNGLGFPLFTADFSFTNGGRSPYPSNGIPTSYIIDRSGNVVALIEGSRDWSQGDIRRFVESVLGVTSSQKVQTEVPVANAPAGFSGKWSVSWNDTGSNAVTMTIDGTKGEYAYLDGVLTGKIVGKTFTGTWTQSNGRFGWFRFELSADGKKFDGTWGYETGVTKGKWNGKRL